LNKNVYLSIYHQSITFFNNTIFSLSSAEHHNEHINSNAEWYNTGDGSEQLDHIPAES